MSFSIIQKSQLEGNNRLDAEYYQPEYFIDFKKGNWQPIGSFLNLCQYGISQSMNDEGIGFPILKMNDIDNAFLVDDCVRYVDLQESLLPQYKLGIDDVLFNRVNAENFVGRTGIFKLNKEMVFASYLIRLQVKVNSKILPDYLNIFLNSSFGIKQIRKWMRRAVNQANVNAEELKQIKIAVLSKPIQELIKKLSDDSWQQIELSKKLYFQAENLLLEELGLKDFKPKEDLSFVVNYSDVKKANRIDADYFQPKYQEILEIISKNKTLPLKSLVKNYSAGCTFKSEHYLEQGIPLIRINNIKKGLLDLADTAYLSKEDHLLSPKDIAKPGDIVISMSGTVGSTALIPENIPVCSINQRILRFTPVNINSDYIVLLLNSIIGKCQLERIGTGGVQTNISYKDIKNTLIPILEKSIQQKIADLVKKSHEARKKSKELLEEAKRKVEEMIERR